MIEKFKVGQIVYMTLPVQILDIHNDGDEGDEQCMVETFRDVHCCNLPAEFWCFPDELKKTGE